MILENPLAAICDPLPRKASMSGANASNVSMDSRFSAIFPGFWSNL